MPFIQKHSLQQQGNFPLAFSFPKQYNIHTGYKPEVNLEFFDLPKEDAADERRIWPRFSDRDLEYVDTHEHNGLTYTAFFPAVEEDADEDDADYGLVILKTIVENGEELLSTLDSEEELNEIYQLFSDQLFADDDDEE